MDEALVCVYCLTDKPKGPRRDKRLTILDGKLVCMYHLYALNLMLKEEHRKRPT